LRKTWVFDGDGPNFVTAILRLAQTRDTLNVVSDQVGGPTPASAIADACLTIATAPKQGRGAAGVYHFAGPPNVSWADFAREIFARSGDKVTVNDITTADYPTPAIRPQNSRLDCSSLADVFGNQRPDWATDLDHILQEKRT
jgi:dTDP-4-dehydrorhamnose reductase